jgi:pimeloyl-ACP methyl ester carboxylesterase
VFVEEVSIRSIEQARSAYMQPGERGLRARLARHHKNVDNAFWQWNDIWLDPAFLSFDIRHECQNIQAPVLAIQGASDEYGTLQQVRDIQPKNAAARTLVLEACGHSPHRDQPDAVLAAIGEFLSELP